MLCVINCLLRFPRFHHGKVGLEISSDWYAMRSRIAIDEGVSQMFVAIPVKARADFCAKAISLSPFNYGDSITVYTGYGIEVDLPKRVDFIFFEPPPAARERKQLAEEDAYILDLIKKKHLVSSADNWQRILFI